MFSVLKNSSKTTLDLNWKSFVILLLVYEMTAANVCACFFFFVCEMGVQNERQLSNDSLTTG